MKKISILALNTGSSSIKFSLYALGEGVEERILAGSLTRIGFGEGVFSAGDGSGESLVRERFSAPDHESACERVFSWLLSRNDLPRPAAVGHRIVHGGPEYTEPVIVTPEVTASLERLVPFAPEHLPQALRAVRHAGGLLTGIPQVACFDTAFHRTMPGTARTYPLPAAVRREGVRRYGFHGLSYEYLVDELRRLDVAGGRIVLAHLGHGASMAAVRDGESVDTTMGFSPAGGLVMSTRTGDLDPGVILFLLQQGGMTAPEVKEMVNRRSGLLGLSEKSDDMRDLLEAAGGGDEASRAAVELFCYQARKHAGALAAALGGIDAMVFTGGIGEHSPDIRSGICDGLGFLGVDIDEQKNRENLPVISKDNGSVVVRVMSTNEELMIARQTLRAVNAVSL